MTVVVLLFLCGFVLLCKGGDVFVDEAVYFARRFCIPEVIIGATIVSIGTTLPEVTVSALASLDGITDIAYGNAIGSITCNTTLIAGLLLLMAPTVVSRHEISRETGYFFAASGVFLIASEIFGMIHPAVGLLFLALFALFIVSSIRRSSRAFQGACIAPVSVDRAKEKPFVWHIFAFGAAVAAILVGSQLLINNGMCIAQYLKVPERIIALSFIALGTSLPELVTAISSIVKGHGAVSLGNIIGANFMNLTVVVGISSVISPMPMPPLGSLTTDLCFSLIPMLLLTVPIMIYGKTMRLQGLALLLIYVSYGLLLFR